MSLPHNASHADSIQPIFNITVDSTIHEVREFLEEMKNELAIILQQTPDEVISVYPSRTLKQHVPFLFFKDLNMAS